MRSAIAETARGSNASRGTPDILINNAGAGRWRPMIETTAEEALHMIEVPYLAAFNLTRAFLPGDACARQRRHRLHHLARLLPRLAECLRLYRRAARLAGFTEALAEPT